MAQSVPKLSVITTNEGLGFRHVNSISQDKRGLMWICTHKSLERYDGNEFITFSSNKNADVNCPFVKTKMAATQFVHDEIMMVYSSDKLFTVDLCSNEVNEFLLPSKYDGTVNNFFISSNQVLYISVVVEKKEHILSYADNNFKLISSIQVDKYYRNEIEEDKDKNIWISDISAGLKMYDPSGKLKKQIKIDSFIWFESKFYFNEFFIDKQDDIIYIFPKRNHEIKAYHIPTGKFVTILDSLNSPVYNAVKDEQGNIWFSTRTNVIRYNKKDKERPIVDYTNLLQATLQYTSVEHLFVDQTNILWVSTNNGIIKIPLSKQLFDNVLNINNKSWGNEMRGIAQGNESTMYTFCENGEPGFYKIDSKTKETTLLFKEEDDPGIFSSLKHLIYDKAHHVVWAINSQLNKIDIINHKAERIPIDVKEFTTVIYNNPISMLHDGRLIFGYNGSAIALYNPSNGALKKIKINTLNPENLIVTFYAQDHQYHIWIGTDKGLFILSPEGKTLHEFNEKSNPALSNNYCLSITKDKKGRMWVGTFGGGINIFESTNTKGYFIKVLDQNLGLCDDNITALLVDDQQNVWASSYNGISRIDHKVENILNFYVEDGLTHNEFNYTSACVDNEGRLWFGGMNGINIIDPVKSLAVQSNPPLVLTSFTLNNKLNNEITKSIISLDEQKTFVIPPGTSWFQFNWSLPNYFNSNKNRYYVWLDGSEDNWSYHGNNPYIRYNTLRHGNYTLKVKATDSKGNLSLGELSIPIVVQPFFYQTWWFTGLWILMLGGLFYALYRYNLNKKLAMERMRTQIASDLHDEVGSMLSGLAMQSELLNENATASNTSKLQNIANLSRNVVGKMRDLVWSIDASSDSVKELLNKMHEKLAVMLGPKDIAYQLNSGDLPLDKILPVLTRQQIYMIFNESVTNIVRHSNATEVVVYIGNVKQQFIMSIKDNGTVLPTTQHVSAGLGLKNMKLRASRIKGQVECIREDGFEIRFTMEKW